MDGVALVVLKGVWDWLSPVLARVAAEVISRRMKARRARRAGVLGL